MMKIEYIVLATSDDCKQEFYKGYTSLTWAKKAYKKALREKDTKDYTRIELVERDYDYETGEIENDSTLESWYAEEDQDV